MRISLKAQIKRSVSKKYCLYLIIFSSLFILSCTNQYTSLNTNPNNGYQIIVGDIDDITDAIYDGLELTFPSQVITPLGGKKPGFTWFVKPLLDRTTFKLYINKIKGVNNNVEINGYIYEITSSGTQGLVKSRYIDPLVKKIKTIFEQYEISYVYVSNYEFIKFRKSIITKNKGEAKDKAIIIPTSVLGDVKETTKQTIT